MNEWNEGEIKTEEKEDEERGRTRLKSEGRKKQEKEGKKGMQMKKMEREKKT